MKVYGIPYMGSKDKIADSLMKVLPSGKRFVDLFGGGFAMSECAIRSGKYQKILFNDLNPLIVNLVLDAIKGKYNFKNFNPVWISREDFEREREREMVILNTFGHLAIMVKHTCTEKISKTGKK